MVNPIDVAPRGALAGVMPAIDENAVNAHDNGAVVEPGSNNPGGLRGFLGSIGGGIGSVAGSVASAAGALGSKISGVMTSVPYDPTALEVVEDETALAAMDLNVKPIDPKKAGRISRFLASVRSILSAIGRAIASVAVGAYNGAASLKGRVTKMFSDSPEKTAAKELKAEQKAEAKLAKATAKQVGRVAQAAMKFALAPAADRADNNSKVSQALSKAVNKVAAFVVDNHNLNNMNLALGNVTRALAVRGVKNALGNEVQVGSVNVDGVNLALHVSNMILDASEQPRRAKTAMLTEQSAAELVAQIATKVQAEEGFDGLDAEIARIAADRGLSEADVNAAVRAKFSNDPKAQQILEDLKGLIAKLSTKDGFNQAVQALVDGKIAEHQPQIDALRNALTELEGLTASLEKQLGIKEARLKALTAMHKKLTKGKTYEEMLKGMSKVLDAQENKNTVAIKELFSSNPGLKNFMVKTRVEGEVSQLKAAIKANKETLAAQQKELKQLERDFPRVDRSTKAEIARQLADLQAMLRNVGLAK